MLMLLEVVLMNKQIQLFHYVLQLIVILILAAVTTVMIQIGVYASSYIYVTTEAELRAAAQNEEAVIIVNTTIHLTVGAIEIDGNITVQGHGIIEVTDEFRHFIVNEGAELTLDGNITLQSAIGRQEKGGINVRGTLNMHGGVITNNSDSAVTVSSGTFNMYDGVISNSGGVTLWDSTFNMYGGIISNNRIRRNKAGVNANYSIINFYGGVIRNNNNGTSFSSRPECTNEIYLLHSLLVMYDGEIIGNHSSDCDTIWFSTGSHGVIHSGIINGSKMLDFDSTLSIIDGQVGDIYASFNENVTLGTNATVGEIIDREYSLFGEEARPFYTVSHLRFRPYIHIGFALVILLYKLICMAFFFKRHIKDKRGIVQNDIS